MLLGCWILGRDGPHLGSGRGTLEEKNWSPFPGDQKREEIKRKNEKDYSNVLTIYIRVQQPDIIIYSRKMNIKA
jgi:hypothetical protein